jgi:hypothetical protein
VARDHLSSDIPVQGVLCFVEADWPLFGGSFSTRGVDVLWPKKLYSKLQAEGSLTLTSDRRDPPVPRPRAPGCLNAGGSSRGGVGRPLSRRNGAPRESVRPAAARRRSGML